MEAELWPIEVLHCGNTHFKNPFCPCDLDLDPMTFIYELDPYFLKKYRICEINFLHQVSRKFSYYSLRMLAISYVGHFRSRDKGGVHTIRSVIVEKPMIHANFMALCFIEPELLPMEFLHCRNRDFRFFFVPVTLTLNQ